MTQTVRGRWALESGKGDLVSSRSSSDLRGLTDANAPRAARGAPDDRRRGPGRPGPPFEVSRGSSRRTRQRAPRKTKSRPTAEAVAQPLRKKFPAARNPATEEQGQSVHEVRVRAGDAGWSSSTPPDAGAIPARARGSSSRASGTSSPCRNTLWSRRQFAATLVNGKLVLEVCLAPDVHCARGQNLHGVRPIFKINLEAGQNEVKSIRTSRCAKTP